MTKKLTLLVIDDEPNITTAIRRVLVKEGFEVITLNDPRKVEDHLLYTDLNLVITDLKMPGMDGFAVLDLIRQSKPDLPVIFLTGVAELQTAVEATKAGAVEYITKPVNSGKLIELVKKHAKVDQAVPEEVQRLIKEQISLNEEEDAVDPNKILLDDEITSSDTVPDGFVDLKFDDILPGQLLPFALYIQIYNKGTKKLYLRKICRENTVFTSGLKNILEKRQLAIAYIRQNEYGSYLEYISALKSSPQFKIKKMADEKKQVLYGKAVEAIMEIMNGPIKKENITSAINLVGDMRQTIFKDPVTYHDLFKLFQKDSTIFNHSTNVCLLAVSFGLYLKLEPKRIQELGLGALFHDLGMNSIDTKIIQKKGPLTKAEKKEIETHPQKGYSLLEPSTIIPLSSLRIILEHHEKSDGSGYPRGIDVEKIDSASWLCRLVDEFDSLTSNKPYRKAFKAPEALQRIYSQEPEERYKKLILEFIKFLGGQ